jgi:hypothetical protein
VMNCIYHSAKGKPRHMSVVFMKLIASGHSTHVPNLRTAGSLLIGIPEPRQSSLATISCVLGLDCKSNGPLCVIWSMYSPGIVCMSFWRNRTRTAQEEHETAVWTRQRNGCLGLCRDQHDRHREVDQSEALLQSWLPTRHGGLPSRK